MDATELERLADAVEDLAAREAWPPAVIMQVNLVLEEIIVNIIDYGYPDGRPGQIEVALDATPTEIHIHIEDDGDAYDPFAQAPPPDVAATLKDRPIGGLGVYLVRHYMDTCAYQRRVGRNRISLVKRLAPPSPAP